MGDIQNLEIKGFKGIEYNQSEVDKINLITGRNNTGKTSFLQAIHLTYNPGEIAGFRGNMDKLINRNSETAEIRIEEDNEEKELRISRGSDDDDFEVFVEATLRVLLRHPRFRHSRPAGPDLNRQELRRALRDVVSKADEDSIPSSEDSIKLNFNDSKYFYYYWDEDHRDFLYEYLGEIVDSIIDEADDEDDNKSKGSQVDLENDTKKSKKFQRDLKGRKVSDLREQLIEQFRDFVGRTQIFLPIYGNPEKRDGSVRLLTNLTDRPDQIHDVDNKATRVSEIENILIELNLLDNLVDFNLGENIVFEDDGKYEVPYEFMGDGFKAIVNILWHLQDDDIDKILIEEPGVHMHPGYTAKIARFLVEYVGREDVQFFITTHNNDFIQSLFSENIRFEDKEFLEENFRLIQMHDVGAKNFDYEIAKNNLKKQLTDLRGT